MAAVEPPTIDAERPHFVQMAIEHGLLQDHHAEKILVHAQENNIQPSDAALTLSILELYEVDAINLLCEPTSLAPGYELTDLIGCGAGGMVFRARQTALGRDVALKTMNQNATNAKTTGESRIQREAHAIAQLRHPGIVAAFDSGFHQGRFCIAMELVEGETLGDFIRRELTVPEKVLWHIVRQVACALSHANSIGIIHRDIKPANLLLCNPPTGTDLPPGVPFVKVADFGLAFESSGSEASQLTQTGTTLGTPAYVAPEQLHDTHVDARADIYSLGATVFQMLTGQAPCADQTPMRTIMQKTIGDDHWRDDLPETVSVETTALFRDMTETNIEDRIGDYATLIQRIEHVLNQSASDSTSAQQPKERQRHPVKKKNTDRRWRTIGIAAGSLIVTMVGIAGFSLSFAKPTQQSLAKETTTQWSVNGFPLPLFNGKSVPLFLKSGSWSPEVDTDGSRVLAGLEGSWMTIPLALEQDRVQNVRLRMALNLQHGSTVEVDLQLSDREVGSSILRIRQNTAELVTADNAAPSAEHPKIELTQSTGDDVVFQRVAILRQGSQCVLRINGESLGTVPCAADAVATIHLRCIRGKAHFADLDIVAIKPDGTKDQTP